MGIDAETRAWIEAGRRMGFRVIAPFVFRFSGREHSCVALLPDFGSAKGMLIRSQNADGTFMSDASEAGFGFTHVEIAGASNQGLIDMLSDWGWAGAASARPTWIRNLDDSDAGADA